MTDDLTEKVTKWLTQTGLPFEMQVARTLKRAGLDIVQSSYYRDPEEDVSREIDIVATRNGGMEDLLMVRAWVVAECKVTTDRPWVLYVEPVAEATYCADRVMTDRGATWMYKAQFVEAIRQLPLLTLGPRRGYAMTTVDFGGDGQRKDQGKDHAYAAVQVATKAAGVLAKDMSEHPQLRNHAILFPAVILRGRLFEASLDPNGSLTVVEINRGQLVWHNPSSGSGRQVHLPGGERVVVDVVTEAALEQFASDAFLTLDTLVTGTAEQVRDAEEDHLGVAIY